jgi:hypothetical protein
MSLKNGMIRIVFLDGNLTTLSRSLLQKPDLIPYFTQPRLPEMEIDTFIRGGQKIEINPLIENKVRKVMIFLLKQPAECLFLVSFP